MREADLEVSCQHVQEQLAAGEDFLLLDCREPDEYAIASIAGARLLPLGELPARVESLRDWRGKPVVVMCHHGMRSAQAAQWLRGQGFDGAASMAGGIDQWSQQIDAAVPRY